MGVAVRAAKREQNGCAACSRIISAWMDWEGAKELSRRLQQERQRSGKWQMAHGKWQRSTTPRRHDDTTAKRHCWHWHMARRRRHTPAAAAVSMASTACWHGVASCFFDSTRCTSPWNRPDAASPPSHVAWRNPRWMRHIWYPRCPFFKSSWPPVDAWLLLSSLPGASLALPTRPPACFFFSSPTLATRNRPIA